MLGRAGKGYRKGRVGHKRTYGATVTPPPPDASGAWPSQAMRRTGENGGWGINWNGSVADMTTFWNALSSAAKNETTHIRIQSAWYSIEPRQGVYDFSSIRPKVDWCKARGIIAVLDFTYTPWFYTVQLAYTGATITNVGGKGRITITGLRSGYYSGLGQGVHIRGAGIPVDTWVTGQGAGYVDVNRLCSAGSHPTDTYTFGGYQSGGHTYVTEHDRHLPPSDTNMPAGAKAVAALVTEFHDEGAEDIYIETGNEPNKSLYFAPYFDVPRYCRFLRHLYRGVLEVTSEVPVLFASLAAGEASGGWNAAAEDYTLEAYKAQKADTTWRAWVTDTGANFTPYSKQSMASLLAAGRISPRFFNDRHNYHWYQWNRFGATSLGAKNYLTWRDPAGTPTHFMEILNHMYQQDPWEARITGVPTGGTFVLGVKVDAGAVQNSTAIAWNAANSAWVTAIESVAAVPSGTVQVSGTTVKLIEFEGSLIDNNVVLTLVTNSLTGGTAPTVALQKHGLDRMLVDGTESGVPFNRLAVTGRGWTGGGTNRNLAAILVKEVASSEEAYDNTTALKQILKVHKPFPTGGGMPAKLGTWDPRKRMGFSTLHRLKEQTDEASGYDAGAPAHYGMISNGTVGVGAEQITPGELKRALPADRPRPYLNTGVQSDANIGTGADPIDAYGKVWDDDVGTPVITTASVPDATVGSTYSKQMNVQGGSGTQVWSVTGFGFSGITINSSTGLLSATNVTGATGDRTVVVSVSVGGVAATPRTYTMTVNASGSLRITNNVLAPYSLAAPYTGWSDTLVASGGTAPYSWFLTIIPAGEMAIDDTTGRVFLQSDPEAHLTPDTYTVQVRLIDTDVTIVNKDISWDVTA